MIARPGGNEPGRADDSSWPVGILAATANYIRALDHVNWDE